MVVSHCFNLQVWPQHFTSLSVCTLEIQHGPPNKTTHLMGKWFSHIYFSLSLFLCKYIYTNIITYTYTLIIIHLHVFIWGCWWSTFCGGEHIIRFPSVHSLEISRAPLAQVREGDHTIVAKNGFQLTQATLGFASENCQTWFVISHYIRVHNHCC